MTTILGLSGSLRKASFNSRLLATAATLMPEGTTLEIASIRGIPLYDGDVEAESGVPDVVRALQDRIAAADGLLVATPEYNHSVPGVVKNAVDWLSRPPKEIPRVFGGLPVALTGVTPGRGGTALAQAAWLPILRTLGTRPFFGRALQVADAGKLFDENGLTDEETRGRLAKLLKELVAFAAETKRKA